MNVSEGRDLDLLAKLSLAAGPALLDLHRDAEHHRSVLTLGAAALGDTESAVRAVVAAAVRSMSLSAHVGVHPRLGVVDVVPFVPLLPDASLVELERADLAEAVAARDRFAVWAADELDLPCFIYGPRPSGERTLPELRRSAFVSLMPDTGPPKAHPSAGACCVGARRALVAYNLVLSTHDLAKARRIAAALRSADVRSLAFPLDSGAQVSCNLVAPWSFGPAQAYAAVAALSAAEGTAISSAELVGLVPGAVLKATAPTDWERLDLGPDLTLEGRLDR
ncbi:MAG: Formiminotransferase domain protein [Acidimicrobiaceae bacterium]|nr:Formiminotransferase domain protein [Acidimicrobiaceae bacterium]